MKRGKLLFSGLAAVAVVGSALAFTNSNFRDASVYCASTCATASKVGYFVDPSGLNTAPCGLTAGNVNPIQPYVLKGTVTIDCVATDANATFTAVHDAK